MIKPCDIKKEIELLDLVGFDNPRPLEHNVYKCPLIIKIGFSFIAGILYTNYQKVGNIVGLLDMSILDINIIICILLAIILCHCISTMITKARRCQCGGIRFHEYTNNGVYKYTCKHCKGFHYDEV